MFIKKTHIAVAAAIVLLGGTSAYSYLKYRRETVKNQQLEQQLHELSKKEKRSAIVQHISAQMEEIASEQKNMSDEQRRAAEEQTQVAQEERQRAEIALQKAMAAERAASASEQRAVEASKVANRQRELAEEGRREADFQRSVADTLSYLSLARSLGIEAVNQENTGNHELATLLAYASYEYTTRYGGDPYQPATFQALSMMSKSNQAYSVGKGAIMKTIWFNDSTMTFVSTYGEMKNIILSRKGIKVVPFIENPDMDFRDLHMEPDGTFYALSFTGHLISGNIVKKTYNVTEIPNGIHPFRIFRWNDDQILITCEQNLQLIDTKTLKSVKTVPFDFKTSIAGEEGSLIVLFDDNGKMYYYGHDNDRLVAKDVPDHKTVMSFTHNVKSGMSAFGTNDGIIYLKDKKGHVTKLVGHRSRVSRVKFQSQNSRLYSNSYDGTIRFWNINSNKIEPMTILNEKKWIVSISFDKTGDYIWAGDQNGNMNKVLISVMMLAEQVKGRLTRDFTQEEWAYFIGNKVPKESFYNK